jgi:hypothetical protein
MVFYSTSINSKHISPHHTLNINVIMLRNSWSMLTANPTQELQAQAHLRGYTNQSSLGSQIRKQKWGIAYCLLLTHPYVVQELSCHGSTLWVVLQHGWNHRSEKKSDGGRDDTWYLLKDTRSGNQRERGRWGRATYLSWRTPDVEVTMVRQRATHRSEGLRTWRSGKSGLTPTPYARRSRSLIREQAHAIE